MEMNKAAVLFCFLPENACECTGCFNGVRRSVVSSENSFWALYPLHFFLVFFLVFWSVACDLVLWTLKVIKKSIKRTNKAVDITAAYWNLTSVLLASCIVTMYNFLLEHLYWVTAKFRACEACLLFRCFVGYVN